ncbi:MBL fold metallo-hydrolase [Corynebacterium macginleyi]|uniref:MBL fold metallo-hydrolase n=1 Tax=Corynebacterium macginleyi TaxID=38290 RepID=A0ABS1Y6W9_9CORY|nr:MBL fold metallo-hydrolase [Corynebacterium macginleyi]MBK4150769.1 MBL fold metallo-hydrolase [Corynebacterium macginleyi]MBK4152223.1 MBL fold metallo-hydrolase [Corynebacterium macginleyi]MBK4160547.1 MBL fold metallo-hydrolase [Corynebacterium macginleyi]MBK4162778.1 MBL fold metallo-hydrolase [Corynebacterium macginleyi]MBK4164846.1 MBL fold metallo-hydrolase [Corynebacterium macginleyi]
MTNELQLHQISVSEMDNNCYLLTAGDEGLLVDAADDAPAILDMAHEAGVDITAVLTTHRHWDHVRALGEILQTTKAKHYASFIDSPAIPEDVDVELREGDSIEFAGMKLPVIILRGHTPGGVALVATVDGVTNLFVGDSVFPGGLGRTTSEGDFVRLYKDVTQRIFEDFPDDAIIRPGHGKSTTLGEERPKLGDWWERRW